MPDIQTYKDDPAKFVDEAYSEWKDHYDTNVRDADDEGFRLFCGYSTILEKRRRDRWTKRSSYFVHLIQPHVTSRVSQFMSIILSEDPPLKFHPLPGTSAENAEVAQKVVVRRLFGERLQNVNKFVELLTAAELRKLAVAKIGVETESWRELREVPDTIDFSGADKSIEESVGLKSSLPIPTEPYQVGLRKDVVEVKGAKHPTWWLLPKATFFYDPYPSDPDDWLFCGDVQMVSEYWVKSQGARFHNVNDALSKKVDSKSNQHPDDTEFQAQQPVHVSYSTQSQSQTPAESSPKLGQHKHFKKECWARVPLKTKEGEWSAQTEIRKIITINGIEVENRPSPWLLFTFPYVLFRAMLVPNQLEGISTAENLAPLQHIKNDLRNNHVDATAYHLFTPMQKDVRSRIMNEAIFDLGRIWNITKLKEYGGIRPITNPQSLAAVSQVFAEERLIEEEAERLSASTNLVQGGAGGEAPRTLGETQMRHEATITRLNLSLVQYAVGIVDLADKHCKIYQQIIESGKGMQFWAGDYDKSGLPMEEQIAFAQINGRYRITMPHVAGYVDDYTRQLMWTMLYDRLNRDPLFLMPQPHYNLVRRLMQAHKVPDLDELLPAPESMTPQDALQLLMQLLSGAGGGGPQLNPQIGPPGATGQGRMGITQSQ